MMDLNEKNLVYQTNVGFTIRDRIKIFFGYKMVVSIVLHADSDFPIVTKHDTFFNLYSNKEMYEK